MALHLTTVSRHEAVESTKLHQIGPRMSLRIRVLRTLNECRGIRADWERLVELEGSGVSGFDVSATFDWTAALWEAFLNEEPQYVLVAEDESGVRGLLPCTISWQTVAGIRHRQLSLISGSVYELRTGFLVGGDAEVLDQLLAFARKELPSWDSFTFAVIEGSRSDQAQQGALLRQRTKPQLVRAWDSAYIEVHQDPSQVLMDLKSNMRTKLKRRDKELQALGAFEMRVYESPDQVKEFLELMMVVESRSWKSDAGTAMTANAKQQKFYDVVTSRFAERQWFLGAALLLDGAPLAFQYGFLLNGVYVGEKTSYDNDYKDYGVGSALTARLLAEFARRGIHTFDLAGTADSNKAQWTKKTYSRRRYLLFNQTLRGQLLRCSLVLRAFWASRQARKTQPTTDLA